MVIAGRRQKRAIGRPAHDVGRRGVRREGGQQGAGRRRGGLGQWVRRVWVSGRWAQRRGGRGRGWRLALLGEAGENRKMPDLDGAILAAGGEASAVRLDVDTEDGSGVLGAAMA